jgi:uncharacterized protein (TIGR03437 family)
MTRKTRILAMTVLVTAHGSVAQGQLPPPTILTVDLENFVLYQTDSDIPKYATNPSPTPSVLPKNFYVETLLADIVAVNGQPAKGLYAARGQTIVTSPAPAPGGAIADTTHNSIRQQIFEILKSDGTPIGTIIALGLSAGNSPPGSPAAQLSGNWTIAGGTGAYLGARGQVGNGGNSVALRNASVSEDPSDRRINGGGKARWVLTVIPMFRPEVVAVTHSADFSLVTAAKPAAAGEILSLFATGLGPVNGGGDPGQPFPASPLAEVNSPVALTVNGKAAEVLSAVGYPGATDGYQVNFRMPSDAAKGVAGIQVSAAWIAGTPVNIAVQ